MQYSLVELLAYSYFELHNISKWLVINDLYLVMDRNWRFKSFQRIYFSQLKLRRDYLNQLLWVESNQRPCYFHNSV